MLFVSTDVGVSPAPPTAPPDIYLVNHSVLGMLRKGAQTSPKGEAAS